MEMIEKDRIVQNDKLIKSAETDYRLAMFNNQFEQAVELKRYIKYLFDQKELLEKDLNIEKEENG